MIKFFNYFYYLRDIWLRLHMQKRSELDPRKGWKYLGPNLPDSTQGTRVEEKLLNEGRHGVQEAMKPQKWSYVLLVRILTK